MPPREAAREARILDAAADLIAHYGFDKTTMDEIARAAGVSKGAIYLHFKNKDALLEVLLMRDSDQWIDKLLNRLDTDPQGTTLFTIYRYGWEIVMEMPLLRAIYTRDKRVLGDYIRRISGTSAFAQWTSISREFIENFQRAGVIRADLDPDTVVHLLLALRYGLFMMDDLIPREQTPPLDQIGTGLAILLAEGFSPHQQMGSAQSDQALRQMLEGARTYIHERLRAAQPGA